MQALSNPTFPANEAARLADLRRRAASRLAGDAARMGTGAGAADALAVLHALASAPATAADALALLHELQVHQVELDLQAQELKESRAELESALRRQIELYDFQPAGSFTVDERMVLHELNRTGAAMLGVARDDAYGQAFDTFLDADSARRFRTAVASLGAGAPQAACAVALCPRDGPVRAAIASLGADPAGRRVLVSLTPALPAP